MTPLQFAREFCANFQSDGSCLGAWIADNGSIQLSRPQSRCVLPARCRYFEECVVPNAEPVEGPQSVKLRAAVREYARVLPPELRMATESTPRYCECGALLARRKRYCPACRNAKRRAAWRYQRQKGSDRYT